MNPIDLAPHVQALLERVATHPSTSRARAAAEEALDVIANLERDLAQLDADGTRTAAYRAERRTELEAEAEVALEAAVATVEREVSGYLSRTRAAAQPRPPADDPALAEAKLLGARADARDALSNVPEGERGRATVRLFDEALAGGEYALAYALAATPWADRFLTGVDQGVFREARGRMLDSLRDERARRAAARLERDGDLERLPGLLRTAWKGQVGELGMMDVFEADELAQGAL